VLVVAIGALALGEVFARQAAVTEINTEARDASELLASSLGRELEQYRLASRLLAQDSDAVRLLEGERGTRLSDFNQRLESLSESMGAAAIYLLDTGGTTLAASNWRKRESFVGQNYAFRAYFREAMRTGSHEQFALGNTTGRPGLYIARQLVRAGRPVGVIVAKVEMDSLEAEWRQARVTAFATNSYGVILVSSVPEWRFDTIRRIDPAAQQRMLNEVEYGTRPLSMLPHYGAGDVRRADDADAWAGPWLEATAQLENGWMIHVLHETRPRVDAATAAMRQQIIIGLMVPLLLVLLVVFLRRSLAYRAERAMFAQRQQLNERLMQFNKLATLGQIAAGVGHEINQPLSAVTAYAANAQGFLKRGDLAQAQENLDLILKLAGRIGAITGELRGFARKSTGAVGAVRLADVTDGALLLLRDRIQSSDATIHVGSMDHSVLGEAVRLEQVLVNLIQNSLDAGQAGIVIELSAEADSRFVSLTVSDNGPGLSDVARQSLFQPFSTTKREGLGLGLVISRDIMIDLGGELVALPPDRGPEPGASFVMRIQRAP
jgi:two-component system, NtrC family, C4-dicarboxylate transport sensor histidine kinase DctB